MLSEPTDGLTKSTLSLTLIIFVYLYPVLITLIKYHMKIVGSYVVLSGDKNVSINHGQCHSKQPKPLLQMHIKVCVSDADPPDEPFSWDTDGISFIIDNSATAIISNVRKLFTLPLKPTRVTMETADGIITHTKLVGSLRLVLTDDSN